MEAGTKCWGLRGEVVVMGGQTLEVKGSWCTSSGAAMPLLAPFLLGKHEKGNGGAVPLPLPRSSSRCLKVSQHLLFTTCPGLSSWAMPAAQVSTNGMPRLLGCCCCSGSWMSLASRQGGGPSITPAPFQGPAGAACPIQHPQPSSPVRHMELRSSCRQKEPCRGYSCPSPLNMTGCSYSC